MHKNLGTLDRALRAALGVVALVAAIAAGVGTAGGIVLLVVAALLLATSAVSICPLYSLLHIDTRGGKALPQ